MSAESHGEGVAEGAGGAGGAVHHPRSFKLRFAAQREPGRSYVSLVKPLGLPATVTGKFYARGAAAEAADEERERAALRRIDALFGAAGREEGGREELTEARQVGRWWRQAAALAARSEAARLAHHMRDSAWLRARLRVVAEDARLRSK